MTGYRSLLFMCGISVCLASNPCDHMGSFGRLDEPGYYSPQQFSQETTSKIRCAALCLEKPSCTSISMTSLTPSLSDADKKNRLTCNMSDGRSDFVSDSQWLTFTLMTYDVLSGACEPRIRPETTPSVTTPAATTTPRTCPPDFMPLDGGCYKYRTDMMTWDVAKTECEWESSHLVELTSLSEQNQIASFIHTIRGVGVTFHGGGQDVNSDGVWEWLNGHTFDFSHWESGVPVGGCLVVPVNPGKWTSGDCSGTPREFMCEIDI